MQLSIPLSVTDAGSATANGSLTIEVIDDVPTATADTASVGEGATLSVDAASGVLSNDVAGADGWADSGAVVGVVAGDTGSTSSGGVGGRIDGDYGYLTLNADGSYVYVSTANAITGDEVEVFTYTVRDGDGDLSSTTLSINVADVTLPPVNESDSVNESGLVGGSGEGDDSHSTSSQVTVPPGLEVVPGSGTTTHGTFTIDDDGNYTYTLTETTSGDTTSDSFTYVTRDANGNTVTNTVTVNIVDDVPVAVDDTNSIPSGSYVAVTGELIDGGLGGTGQDTEGADGATVTAVTNSAASTSETVPSDGSSITIDGQYGVLTVEADGSYSYQRNPGTPGGVQDVFEYTLTDGDNDTDTATLTIDIGNAAPGISGLTPSTSGGELFFEERHLADGSAPDSSQLSKVGSFTVSSPDGIASLVVGGVTVISDGALSATTTVTTPQGHTLEVTGFNPLTGVVSYEYTLTGRENHDQSVSDNELFDDIGITLLDQDGQSASDTLSVRIVDDEPEANNDSNRLDEDTTSVSGNVIANGASGDVADTEGADGASVTAISSTSGNPVDDSDPAGELVVVGEYGTLTIQPDGSYEYVLNNDNAEVNALKDGETLSEVFSYTLTDADGDADTATLIITIDGNTDGAPSITPADDNGNGAIDGDNTVRESGLVGGSSAGDDSHITSGSIEISAADGLASVMVGGQGFTLSQLQGLSAGSPSAAISVEGGTLVLTGFTPSTSVGGVPTAGTLTYTYTLSGERTHSSAGNDDVQLSIPLSVTDAGNATANGSLTIEVIDDVPTAVNDSANVASGEFQLVLDGNVLDNDTQGADGARVTGVGHEDDASETNVPGAGNLVIDGEYGKLTIHSDGSYSYQRAAGTPGGVQDVFTYTITDGDGDTANAELTINIADATPTADVPTAGGASTTVYEAGLPGGSDSIADRATTSGTIEFTSADGVLAVSLGGNALTTVDQVFATTGPDGSLTARYEYDAATGEGVIRYSYTLQETTVGDDTSASFPVVITDQDNDSLPASNLLITIVDDQPRAVNDQGTVTEGDSLSVNATDGVLGNDNAGADGWNGTGAVVGVEAGDTGTTSATGVATVINGLYGTLTLNADGSYTYVSTANAVIADAVDVFTYTVRDADGDETTATLTINVNDVTGTPRNTTDSVDEAGLSDGTDPTSDREVAEGSLNLDSGWTVAPGSVGPQSSSVGTLIINADGSYSYTLTSETTDVDGVQETDSFSYVAVDQYGNTVTNTVTITIVDDVPSVTLTGNALAQLQVDETSMGIADSADFSGAFSHDFGADGDNGAGLVFTLEVDAAATGLVDTLTGQDIDLVDNAGVIEGQNADGDVVFTVAVDASGEVILTQSRPVQHANSSDPDDVVSLPNGSLLLTATATDGDGDVASDSVDIGGRLSFRDDGPSIGAAPAASAVDEAWLTTGSGDGDLALSTTAEADLDVDFGADGQGSLVFSDDQAALRNWLDASGNTDISIGGTGTDVLTGTRGGQEIFTVTLTVDGSGQAKYSFELKGAMLHRSPTQDHELTFSYDALDGDDDSVSGTFRVDVRDDEPRSDIAIEVDEDGSEGPFTTSADATQDNTSISTTNGGAPIVGTDGPEGKDYDVGHGTVTVHDDGRLTYTPNPDYSNYGGSDEFYVTVTEDNGTQQTIRVTATVNPVADAPELTVDAASVSTDEDVAISLGLNTPEVSDDNDQNLAASGDDPELLGLITLSGIPDGAALLDGLNADAELAVSSGGDISILLSDGPHLSDLLASPPAGTLVMTSAQYAALKVLPAEDAHENFTVDVAVTSYEVDGSGVRITGIPGAQSSTSVAVNVDAVTDPVSLSFTDDTDTRALTINEDSTYDLAAALKVEYPDNDGNTSPDLDGSEERWFEIAGLPVGSTVTTAGGDIEVTVGNPVVRVPAPGLSTSSTGLPQMDITPPADYSGDAVAVTVTLKAQDRDSDSPAATPAVVQDSVTLNLQVDPVPDAPVVEGVSTAEDTAVEFLANVQPGDTDGSEELIAITVKDIPAGWTVQDHLGNTLTPTGGELQIDPSDVASGDYLSYTIQPAGHSSLDATLKLDIEVRDNSNDGAVGPTTQTFTDIDLEVEVTPVAETTDTDTNGVGGNDVTLTPGHDYTTSGEEDAWFSLGTEPGFTLSDDWANEDGTSEKTFALLTPNLVAGDGSASDALGSSFRYSTDGGTSWVTQTYGGEPIEVPVEYLDTLQFKAAPNFSGSFSIDVQALTRDYDEDDLGAGNTVDSLTPEQLAALSYDEAISGSAVLTNVLIKPVADTATTTVTAHVRGNEDEVMPLSIRPSSSDPSETFNVTISAIPDGAILVYDGVALTADATGLPPGFTIVSSGDSWSLSIDGFDPDLGAGMTIQTPEDSNEPFTLTVDTVSVDTLDVPGDPGSPYVSESSAYSLDILISPKGVADEAQLTIVDPADQTFEESTVDANGGVALNQLITSAALTDDDGSEVLSFRVSNLPEGFSLQGGTLIGDGVWSLTEAQLQTAKLVTPANFNGTASFNFYSVTTEDDGDSLTELHAVSLRVQPSPEATINLSASIDEDVSTALSFGIQHQNGDTDEQLDAVWLSASDVDGATDFTLTYGASGVSLAQAVTDGLPGITLEDGWYKLSGDALNSIHAQGRENWSGSAEIDVRYLITDPAADGTVSDVQSATDDSYSITVNPVTDQPVLTVTGGETSSLAAPGDVVVALNVANQGGDYDGSEQLNRIILDNVPDGVIVEGGEYLGGGQWMLVPETAFGGELTPSVTLKVQARAGGLENHPIQVTVITEDSANGQQLTDSTTISLSTTFAEGEATPPAEILQWEQSDFEPTEDTAFTLDQGINAEIENGVADNGFTVTLTDLPAGTTVSGMRLTVIDGQQVWTASGVGGDAELQTLLNSITVTPPADWNKHDGDFVYNAKLTTYIPSGDRAEAEITMQQTVVPVTDDADILITAPAVAEGNDLEISIDLSNAADDPNWTLIDGLLYVTLDEPVDMQGGVLQDELGNPLTQSAVSGVEGVPDGSYYVLDVSGTGNSANLRYTPVNQHVSGSIGLGVVARGQELDSSLVKTTTTTATATIEPVNSGYDFAVADTTGSENTFAQAQADKSNVIQLQVTDGGLVDADGSESVGTILLNGLPNGFLVYVGSSAADATLASLGSNAGAGADGSNTWLLGEGELPAYIGIMPPAHWSGTLDELRLIVNSQESALSQVAATEREFSLTVEAVAEGLGLNPTPSFGTEGDIIRLNLNTEMSDIAQAGPDDSSVETITLQFKGMGEHAAFFLDDVLISGGSNVTYVDGVYTIEGLTQEQIDGLGFVQSADALGNVEVRGRTVESENGDVSEWTHDEAAAWAPISTNVATQFGTTGDDQLLWTGSLINGRTGEDTIQLRFDESVSGNELGSLARNIETIDLSGRGENSISSLSAEDVFDMTDARNTLRIDGDAGGADSVELDAGSSWTLNAGAGVSGYDVYTATVSSQTVVLEVAQGVLVE
ncbi:MAG: DUF5801 repeats-in-toxin domain-containing protein [Pseudomonas neustonica]